MSSMQMVVEHAQAWFLAVPPPDAPPTPPPGLGGFGNQVVGVLKWVLSAGAIVGILSGALLIAIGRRNRNDTAINGFLGAGYAVAGLGVGAAATAIVASVPL